jgi:hypothetical protein
MDMIPIPVIFRRDSANALKGIAHEIRCSRISSDKPADRRYDHQSHPRPRHRVGSVPSRALNLSFANHISGKFSRDGLGKQMKLLKPRFTGTLDSNRIP